MALSKYSDTGGQGAMARGTHKLPSSTPKPKLQATEPEVPAAKPAAAAPGPGRAGGVAPVSGERRAAQDGAAQARGRGVSTSAWVRALGGRAALVSATPPLPALTLRQLTPEQAE